MPPPGTQEEADVFDALTVIFLVPRLSERARGAVRTSLGDRRFELPTAFLAFVRTAHYWTETHPELAYEPDMLARMKRHPELAALLLDPTEAAEASPAAQLRRALGELDRGHETPSENERRQAFLLEISDALRPLGDAVQIQGEASRLLREHVGAGWCYHAEFEESGTAVQIVRDSVRSGLPSLTGYHELRDLPGLLDHLLAGKVMHAPDLPTFPFFTKRVVDRYTAIGIQSFVGTPLVKRGRLVAFMMLADTQTRQWNNDEIGLLTEAAERT